MKITKFIHSCVMVEMPKRTAIFDPGAFSEDSLDVASLEWLDDIFITHNHPDHWSPKLMKQLTEKFPDVRITTTSEVMSELEKLGIFANSEPPAGVEFFESPHESTAPLFPGVEQLGIHYLDRLTNPGDSHSFSETKEVLLLPIIAPWGALIKAAGLALELRPKNIVPIHDWHYSEEARAQVYKMLENKFGEQGIEFHKAETGQAFNIKFDE